jgi:hypothetical protein
MIGSSNKSWRRSNYNSRELRQLDTPEEEAGKAPSSSTEACSKSRSSNLKAGEEVL